MSFKSLPNIEKALYITLLVLAILTRFYALGQRATSHDETTHALFAHNLYAGQGFKHDPMMHGPLLFEATALIYFLFGVSDFTARAYAALMGVALVMTPLLLRKWLGHRGALVASAFLLISPSITYYSRYTRHDIPMMLFTMMWLWTIMKYLDEGTPRWLYGTAACFSLMHATKEVNYIYIAIVGGLLCLPFAWQIIRTRWQKTDLYRVFGIMALCLILFGAIFMVSLTRAETQTQELDGNESAVIITIPAWGRIAAGLALCTLLGSMIVVYYGVGEDTMRHIRLFDVLMVIGTLTLPLGSAFLLKFVVGLNMEPVYEVMRTNATVQNMNIAPPVIVWTGLTIGLTLALSIALGFWWNAKHWPKLALIYYAIFLVTYTTFFRWGGGIVSGLVASLGYWLAQQGVQRGSQPWYYYGMIGSLYEYMPILLAAGAGVGTLVQGVKAYQASSSAQKDGRKGAGNRNNARPPDLDLQHLFPLFLLGWALLTWVAYTGAGEKMPWMIVHIALPHILLAAWGVNQLLEDLTLDILIHKHGWLRPVALLLMMVAIISLTHASRSFTHPNIEPNYDQAIGALLGLVLFGGLVVWITQQLNPDQEIRLLTLTLVILLVTLTVRTMVMANFINAELAKEYLVYAHATPDVKVVLHQIEDLSWQTTGTPHEIKVAYGSDGAWPYVWYMKQYPNAYYYGESPNAEQLLDYPVVIAGTDQYEAVEPILSKDYVYSMYKYLWWPVEDYKDLTWADAKNLVTDPELRAALWDIFWKRDYQRYAQYKNPDDPFSYQTWPHRREFRLYVRQEKGE